MQARSPKLLEQHAPFAKLLLRATHELMKQPQYTYEGPAYRCSRIGAIFRLFAATLHTLTVPALGASKLLSMRS